MRFPRKAFVNWSARSRQGGVDLLRLPKYKKFVINLHSSSFWKMKYVLK